jgi:predicted nucleic-acid-binding protein
MGVVVLQVEEVEEGQGVLIQEVSQSVMFVMLVALVETVAVLTDDLLAEEEAVAMAEVAEVVVVVQPVQPVRGEL